MSDPVYEMLWDCAYCGARKLLGLTHRHCPTCGAPQDPDRRYFPREDEKVAVEDHVFVGADVTCTACDAPSSAAAEFCGRCGSPLSGGEAVEKVVSGTSLEERVQQGRDSQPKAVTGPPGARPKRKGRSRRGCLLLLLAAVAVVLVLVFWTSEETVRVAGHTWERSIELEELQAVRVGEWCDAMPEKAYDISRSRKQRSTRKVPDGEDCVTKNVDLGDGTFEQVEECRPRYRTEGIDGDWCDFTVDRWEVVRRLAETGRGLTPPPVWPAVQGIDRCSGRLGCQREGERSERYRVQLREVDGTMHTCSFPRSKWQDMRPGSRWKAEISKVGGGLRCGSLEPAG